MSANAMALITRKGIFLRVQTVHVVEVAIEPRAGGSEGIYTYRAPDGAAIGDAYMVPLANRTTLGFALAVREVDESALGFSMEKLRDVSGRVDGISLPGVLVELARFTAEEYLCPPHMALAPAVPPAIRERLVTGWSLTDKPPESPLSALQQEVVRLIREEGGTICESKSRPVPASTSRALKFLRAKGVVRQSLQLAPLEEKKSAERLLRLTGDEARLEAFLKREGKRRPAQALTLMRLQETGRRSLSASEIKALAGATDSTLKALLDAGLLEAVAAEHADAAQPPMPNPHQQLAIDAIVEAAHRREAKPFLLFGVTGSGKTEVYLRAAAETLRLGRQVLYLVPEIALAAQGIARLRERFGGRVALLHSDLPNTERLRNWRRVREGYAPVVLGARSALFAPLDNIGLIVMDEEHEASYKQESTPRYHAKNLAMFLAKQHSCPLVLGSATPGVESFYEADQGRITLLSLPERAAAAQMPTVHVDDLARCFREGRPALIGDELMRRLGETLAKGEQAILFLNRRAYAPFMMCRDCGQQAHCPRCAVSLSYHRRERRLRCHHCGHHVAPPDKCPKCGGLRFSPFGVGTERVEEAVSMAFPEVRVARLDRDISRKKGALEEILASFRSGDVQVLVGTQMVAKGLDFPKVTLVGVIAADVSLNIPDFRSSERTFQLLSQVAGRAGRAAAAGHVVIQTFNPEHPAVACAQRHDYIAFYEHTVAERAEALYPPFRRLVSIVVSGTSRPEVIETSAHVAHQLREVSDAAMLGPVDCPLERLQGRWRRHVLLKLLPDAQVEPIGAALETVSKKGVQITIDVEPYSLM